MACKAGTPWKKPPAWTTTTDTWSTTTAISRAEKLNLTAVSHCGRIPATFNRILHNVFELTIYRVLLSLSPNVKLENRIPSGAGIFPGRLPSGETTHTPPIPVE